MVQIIHWFEPIESASRLAEMTGNKEASAALVAATLQRLRNLVAINAELCAVMAAHDTDTIGYR